MSRRFRTSGEIKFGGGIVDVGYGVSEEDSERLVSRFLYKTTFQRRAAEGWAFFDKRVNVQKERGQGKGYLQFGALLFRNRLVRTY